MFLGDPAKQQQSHQSAGELYTNLPVCMASSWHQPSANSVKPHLPPRSVKPQRPADQGAKAKIKSPTQKPSKKNKRQQPVHPAQPRGQQTSQSQSPQQQRPTGSTQRPLLPTPRPLHHKPAIRIIGDSNIGKLSSALKNTIPGVEVTTTPGATFEHMIGDVVEAQPCDILILSGGVNDSNLDNVELARRPFQVLLETAKHKAEKVIVMPPPPINHARTGANIHAIACIMAYEADRAGVEFVNVIKIFPGPNERGPKLFSADGKHMTQYGGGIYTWALLDHLGDNHRHIELVHPLCVQCHRTGHKVSMCPQKW